MPEQLDLLTQRSVMSSTYLLATQNTDRLLFIACRQIRNGSLMLALQQHYCQPRYRAAYKDMLA